MGAEGAAVLIGIDTGGTFTDFVAFDPVSGELRVAKVPSDPAHPQEVFDLGLRRVGAELAASERAVHGTTLVTNMVIQGDGARVATVTTRGFRDLVEIGYQNRFEMYDLRTTTAPPLSPRRWRFELDERILHDGTVRTAPRPDELDALTDRLVEADVDAVAVAFLFSYLNPENERLVAEHLHARGDWFVTSSHEIARQSREYPRFSTTVMNAFLGPAFSRYLDELERYLAEGGAGTDRVYLIGTSGGAVSWERARELPVSILNSGPAGGVRGAVEVATTLGIDDLITFDVGGTSTDICLIKGREPAVTSEGYIDRRPLMVPKLDISGIGAGGGSIAWVDLGGELQVGPRSAGADPGPACYKRGGEEPTLTDAMLLLGRLAGGQVLGGSVELDADLAHRAVLRIAERFPGLSVRSAAEGILRIAVARTVTGVREVSVARGLDPRDFCLFAFGGAGGMLATDVAVELGIPRVAIPPSPGNFSALGLVLSDLRHDVVQSRFQRLDGVDPGELESAYAELEERVGARLRADGFTGDRIRLDRTADMRYAGQWFELNVAVPRPVGSVADLDARFRTLHLERYGVDMERPTEVTNYRVAGHGLVDKPRVELADTGIEVESSTRDLIVDGVAHPTRVLRRETLPAGFTFEGPAIVEEAGATTIATPGWRGEVHPTGALLLDAT